MFGGWDLKGPIVVCLARASVRAGSLTPKQVAVHTFAWRMKPGKTVRWAPRDSSGRAAKCAHPGCLISRVQPMAGATEYRPSQIIENIWLGGLDSNQDSQIQSLESYQLDDLPAGRNKKESWHIRLCRRPRFILPNLIGIHEGVNQSAGDVHGDLDDSGMPSRQHFQIFRVQLFSCVHDRSHISRCP